MNEIIDKLLNTHSAEDDELRLLIDTDRQEELFARALTVRQLYYGGKVYARGLIEFTNYCRNNCYYCGLRAENRNIDRYHLTKAEILECTEDGYKLGLRTFVLQGGEDFSYTDDAICDIVRSIKEQHPDCAVTLSIGERSYESYQAYREAGADRYLLRHETADNAHYAMLHPAELSLDNRKRCLWDLKKLGYQVGSGFMVGSPGQTTDNLIQDLRFLQELQPDMIGIGPFLPHHDTPFANEEKGSIKRCLNLIAILRLMFPYALIPATTALGTIHPEGREMGFKAGANVVMPNLSPRRFRKLYSLYDNKLCTDAEAAENCEELRRRIAQCGFELVVDRGDVNKKEFAAKLKP